jgi:carbamate kinase
MIKQLAIVAIGGNSLIEDPKHPDVASQWQAARKTCALIARMVARQRPAGRLRARTG